MLEGKADETGGPAAEFREKILEDRRKDAVKRIRRALNEKPDLAEMFDTIMDGTWKSGEIAERLGVDVKEIYNRKKRLRRFILGLSIECGPLTTEAF